MSWHTYVCSVPDVKEVLKPWTLQKFQDLPLSTKIETPKLIWSRCISSYKSECLLILVKFKRKWHGAVEKRNQLYWCLLLLFCRSYSFCFFVARFFAPEKSADNFGLSDFVNALHWLQTGNLGSSTSCKLRICCSSISSGNITPLVAFAFQRRKELVVLKPRL